jgi:ribosome-binding factor A
MKPGSRVDKVGDRLRDIIAQALITEAGDSRLHGVHIQAVKVSPDLSFARVFWVPLIRDMDTPAERKRLERALEAAVGFLRTRIGTEMKTRIVPGLRFEYDTTAEYARHMDTVLAEIHIPAAADDE